MRPSLFHQPPRPEEVGQKLSYIKAQGRMDTQPSPQDEESKSEGGGKAHWLISSETRCDRNERQEQVTKQSTKQYIWSKGKQTRVDKLELQERKPGK